MPAVRRSDVAPLLANPSARTIDVSRQMIDEGRTPMFSSILSRVRKAIRRFWGGSELLFQDTLVFCVSKRLLFCRTPNGMLTGFNSTTSKSVVSRYLHLDCYREAR
jgi:hypothetical protein